MTKEVLIEAALFLGTIQPNQIAFAESLDLANLKQYLIMSANPPKVKAYKCLYFKEAE